jgi:ankyrin repeat protein
MFARIFGTALAAALLGIAAPAAAQIGGSESYKFLQAVRDAKGDDVTEALNKPGTTIINTRDYKTGETALHIVVKRGDMTYLRFLLAKGADPNLRDDKGTTPLLLAATSGETEMISVLIQQGANVNLGNSSGETPLIRAVQNRDLSTARALLAAGADADQPDLLAGKSARDYATDDARAPAMAKLFADTPKKPRRAVSGPKF